MTDREFRVGPAEPDGDASARVRVGVPVDLRYLDGHFPGNPIVPGVAQLVLVERAVRRAFPALAAPRGVARLKFQARIDPGDTVVVALERRPTEVRFRILRDATECTRGALLLPAAPPGLG